MWWRVWIWVGRWPKRNRPRPRPSRERPLRLLRMLKVSAVPDASLLQTIDSARCGWGLMGADKKSKKKDDSDDEDDTTDGPQKEDPAGVADANALKAECDPILKSYAPIFTPLCCAEPSD
jgi:hypothetical protein